MALPFRLSVVALFTFSDYVRSHGERHRALSSFKRGVNSMSLIYTCMTSQEVSGIKAKLCKEGYAVHDFGQSGFCSEINGDQIFRATEVGPNAYDVRYNERIIRDV
jgi:hypothetical protein